MLPYCWLALFLLALLSFGICSASTTTLVTLFVLLHQAAVRLQSVIISVQIATRNCGSRLVSEMFSQRPRTRPGPTGAPRSHFPTARNRAYRNLLSHVDPAYGFGPGSGSGSDADSDEGWTLVYCTSSEQTASEMPEKMPEADAYDAGDEGDSETDPSSSSSSSSSDDDDDDTSPLPANDTDLQTWETVILARVHALEDVTWETFLKVLIFHAVVILLWTCFPAT